MGILATNNIRQSRPLQHMSRRGHFSNDVSNDAIASNLTFHASCSCRHSITLLTWLPKQMRTVRSGTPALHLSCCRQRAGASRKVYVNASSQSMLASFKFNSAGKPNVTRRRHRRRVYRAADGCLASPLYMPLLQVVTPTNPALGKSTTLTPGHTLLGAAQLDSAGQGWAPKQGF